MINKQLYRILIGHPSMDIYGRVLKHVHAPIMANMSVVTEVKIKTNAFQIIVTTMRQNKINISDSIMEKLIFLRDKD